MIYIAVPDMNDSMSSITIDGKDYIIRFTYNESGDYWNFGIYDIKENPILPMTKIVPNFPLLHFYNYTELPEGIFGVLTEEQHIGRNAFFDKKAQFVYISNEEA